MKQPPPHRTMGMLWTMLLLLTTLCPQSASAQSSTLNDLIQSRNDLTIFRQVVAAVGLDQTILSDTGGSQHTLFAPTDAAITSNDFMNLYVQGLDAQPFPRWHLHLAAVVRNHIVEAAALTDIEIFNGLESSVFSMEGPLHVDHTNHVLEKAQIIEGDFPASNGVLHIIDHVLEPVLFRQSLADLENQVEFGPDWQGRASLVSIVDFHDTRDTFDHIVATGQTHAGCRIMALNRIGLEYLPHTINGSPNGIKQGEFLNATNRAGVIHNFLEYTLIPRNIYRENLISDTTYFEFVDNGCSHVLVSTTTDRLCFNNGCQVATPHPREYLANNGVGYVIDKCIVCSGVAMLLEYAAFYTTYNLDDASQLWETSEWNTRDLRQSIDTQGQTAVTLIAATDAAWTVFTSDDLVRLVTDKWKRHQWDLLLHNMLPGAYTVADFVRLAQENGNQPFTLTSLAGQDITFEYNAEQSKVQVHGYDGSVGDLFLPDIKGVDGYLHLSSALPVPRSVTHTVYDLAKEWPDYSTQITLIDTVFLDDELKTLLPITALYAPNDLWAGVVVEVDDIAQGYLENHFFEDLQWCDSLKAMVGERVESHNGQTWKISVNPETNMPCFNTEQVFGGPVFQSCIVECDILARNGIVHKVDRLLLYEEPEQTGPQPPTAPTPIAVAPRPAPVPTPLAALPRPTFYGFVNPAYFPSDDETETSAAGHDSSWPRAAFLWTTFVLVASVLFL